MPAWGQDRPIFAPARSRSQGPLSDQVADAPNPRGQCRGWVEPGGSIVVTPTAGIGATSPLPLAPAKVALPNRKRALSLGRGNASSCPKPDLAWARSEGSARPGRINRRLSATICSALMPDSRGSE